MARLRSSLEVNHNYVPVGCHPRGCTNEAEIQDIVPAPGRSPHKRPGAPNHLRRD